MDALQKDVHSLCGTKLIKRGMKVISPDMKKPVYFEYDYCLSCERPVYDNERQDTELLNPVDIILKYIKNSF